MSKSGAHALTPEPQIWSAARGSIRLLYCSKQWMQHKQQPAWHQHSIVMGTIAQLGGGAYIHLMHQVIGADQHHNRLGFQPLRTLPILQSPQKIDSRVTCAHMQAQEPACSLFAVYWLKYAADRWVFLSLLKQRCAQQQRACSMHHSLDCSGIRVQSSVADQHRASSQRLCSKQHHCSLFVAKHAAIAEQA